MNKTLNKYLAEFRSTKIGNDLAINVPNMQEFIDSFMENNYPCGFSALQMFSMCEDYSRWLKTPLTLNMFIAVDEDGKFMEEPAEYSRFLTISKGNFNAWNLKLLDECMTYKEAQERIIFEGWYLLSMKGSAKNMNLFLRDNHANKLNFFEGNVRQGTGRVETIGDLIGRIRLFAKIAA